MDETALKRQPSVVYWLGNSLYLNVTNRCSNDCYFCFRRYLRGIEGFRLKLDVEPSTGEVIRSLREYVHRRPWREVVFCGFGEPTARLDCILEVTRWVKKNSGLPVRIDTNGHGYLLNPSCEVIEELKAAGVSRVSVSLNAHDEETYNQVCRPIFRNAYESVMEFVKRARDFFDTEVTAVSIPEVDVAKMEELASSLGVRLRLRQYIPCFY